MFTRDEPNAAMAIGPPGLALPAAGAFAPRRMNSPGPPADAETIQALTLAIRRGDADAFSRFHDRYSFRLYKYLLMLARGNEQDAAEVCQAVLIKLAKRFDVFEDERTLWAWLCALTKNTFIDHCRDRQRRDRFVPLDQLPPLTDAAVAPAHQLSELLRDALAALPADERELIQAVYVDGRPLQELADAAGQTYKAVESRLARLRHKLKEQLLKRLRHENQS